MLLEREVNLLMKIIIFGAGNRSRLILDYPLKHGTEIILICDNDKRKWGRYFCKYIVSNPKEIMEVEYDLVVISVMEGAYDIKKQLLDMGCNAEKIICSQGLEYVEEFECDLDKILDVKKHCDTVMFEKKPAEIYRNYHGETYKSHNRRNKEGFFDKYCKGEGLDIGYGSDPLLPNVSGWDLKNGDAMYLRGIKDESFDFVYSSHCLEHMHDVRIALKNWFRVVKKGGYLIIAVPHRDLYEKRDVLPSRWNFDHRHFFLLGESNLPDTLDLENEIKSALVGGKVEYIKVCDYGHTIIDPLVHSDGEYQIEAVIKKC